MVKVLQTKNTRKLTREGKRVAGRLKDKVIDEYNNLCEYYNI